MYKRILVILSVIAILATFVLSIICVTSNRRCILKSQPCYVPVSDEVVNFFNKKLENVEEQEYMEYLNQKKLEAKANDTCEANAYLEVMVMLEEKEILENEAIARDEQRKTDLRAIMTAQKSYYQYNRIYLTSATYPNNISSYLKTMPSDPGDHFYGWIDNTSDNSKYCVYVELEDGTYFTVSQVGENIRNSIPTLYNCGY